MLPLGVLTRLALVLCAVCCFSGSEGRPTRKRSVSEMQLMHNLGEYRHSLERQEWLQLQLLDLQPDLVLRHPAEVHADSVGSRSARPSKKGDRWGGLRARKLLPEQLQALQGKLGELEQDVLDMIFKSDSE